MLSINHLQVQYGKQVALNITKHVSIVAGDRIGIIGSNGAGKTTFVKSILGLTHYKGSIQTELRKEQIAVHMQFNNYTNTMPVKNIMETLLNTSIKKDEKLQELIAFFAFESCLRKKYSSLSGGQKQRLTIIMVMMQDAPLTFYDEVTSGLDFETRQKLMEKLVDWYREKDNALCIVSHYYDELELLADKVLILDQGEVIDFGSKEKLFQQYCGHAVITIDNNEKNDQLTKHFNRLLAPGHLIALSCGDIGEEREILQVLMEHDVNYKRSNHDIEIMYSNAKAFYYGNKNEVVGA
jgi:ABC-2 type transport system ATP-binding protein